MGSGIEQKLTRVPTHFIRNDLERVTVYQLQPLFDGRVKGERRIETDA